MKCMICKHGEIAAGHASVTLERVGTTLVIKAVPAEVCSNCGEYYLDEATTARIMALVDEAVRKGAEIEVLRYAA